MTAMFAILEKEGSLPSAWREAYHPSAQQKLIEPTRIYTPSRHDTLCFEQVFHHAIFLLVYNIIDI